MYQHGTFKIVGWQWHGGNRIGVKHKRSYPSEYEFIGNTYDIRHVWKVKTMFDTVQVSGTASINWTSNDNIFWELQYYVPPLGTPDGYKRDHAEPSNTLCHPDKSIFNQQFSCSRGFNHTCGTTMINYLSNRHESVCFSNYSINQYPSMLLELF